MLLLIDEADSASADLSLGAFLKTLTERLARRGTDRLLIGLGGLPSLRDVLRESHPSSLRLFHEFFLERLTTDEVLEVVLMSLQRAAHLNGGQEYDISDDALDLLIDLSEGIPHFIQEFGSAAFDADTDFNIDDDDVLDGALDEHGAIAQIGYRYFRESYSKEFDELQRGVLKTVARSDLLMTTKSSIAASFAGDQQDAVDTALSTLLSQGILSDGEVEGEAAYRIRSLAFSMWVDTQD